MESSGNYSDTEESLDLSLEQATKTARTQNYPDVPTSLEDANEQWETCEFAQDFLKDGDVREKKKPKVRISKTLQIAEIPVDDAAPISHATLRNGFPFPEGTNPHVQSVDYTFDLPQRYPKVNPDRLREIIHKNGFLGLVVVKKADKTKIIAITAHCGEREFEVGFKVGKVVVALSPSGNSLAMIAWHKDNEKISVINFVGKQVLTGILPELPLGWQWSGAKFSDDFTLVLEIYTRDLDIFSTLTCPMSFPH